PPRRPGAVGDGPSRPRSRPRRRTLRRTGGPGPRRDRERTVDDQRRRRRVVRLRAALRRPLRVPSARRDAGPRPLVTSDTRTILAAQGVRAVGYGFASPLLGWSLEERRWSPARVRVLPPAVVAGRALVSVPHGTP